MSATLKTENYDLPYFAESDDTDWTAYNDSVNKVDEAMKQNATEAGEAKTVAAEANSNATTAVEQVTELAERVSTNTSNIADATNKVSGLQTTVENLETHMNDVDTEIETAKTDISNNTRNISAVSNNLDTLSATVTQNKRETDSSLQATNNTLNIVKERAQNNENNITALATEQQTISGEIANNAADIALLKTGKITAFKPVSDVTIITNNGITFSNLGNHLNSVLFIEGVVPPGKFSPASTPPNPNGFMFLVDGQYNISSLGYVKMQHPVNGYELNFSAALIIPRDLTEMEKVTKQMYLIDAVGNTVRPTTVETLDNLSVTELSVEITENRRLILNALYGTNVISDYEGYVDTDSVDKKDCVDGPPYPEEDTPVMTKSKMCTEI